MATMTVLPEAPASGRVPDYVARFPMTYEAFLAWDYEGGLAEWVDGEAYLYMTATELHQRIVGLLFVLMQVFVDVHRLGRVLVAPFVMRGIAGGSGREPDILYLQTAHLDRLKEKQLLGPADLVVEVVSEDSPRRDRSDKFDEYQDAGVREYWLIDARPDRRRADFFVLDAGGTFRPIPIRDDGTFHSTVLPGLWLRIDWLWSDEPRTLTAMAEVIGAERLADVLRPRGSSR